MPHRVGTIGDPAAFAARARITGRSWIEPTGDRAWAIRDGEGPATVLGPDEARVSILWKALTFANAAAARVHDEHEDDLDLATVVARFGDDLAARGIAVPPPSDPFTDPEWSGLLARTYIHGAGSTR
jgi:hypothetical protein